MINKEQSHLRTLPVHFLTRLMLRVLVISNGQQSLELTPNWSSHLCCTAAKSCQSGLAWRLHTGRVWRWTPSGWTARQLLQEHVTRQGILSRHQCCVGGTGCGNTRLSRLSLWLCYGPDGNPVGRSQSLTNPIGALFSLLQGLARDQDLRQALVPPLSFGLADATEFELEWLLLGQQSLLVVSQPRMPFTSFASRSTSWQSVAWAQ